MFWRVLAVMMLVLATTPAEAQRFVESDQDRARRALQSGQIQPLDRIMQVVDGAVPGKVLNVDLRGGNGRPWVYRIRKLTPQGNVVRVLVDGRTARIIDVKGRGY